MGVNKRRKRIVKKDFIRDDGKVRYCDSNMSKMNILEFMYYHVFHWGTLVKLQAMYQKVS